MRFVKELVLAGIMLFSLSAAAQFKVDAEIRPRFEYRHGFKTLFPNDTDPAAFVSQRTRLKFNYKNDYLEAFVSLQDVRVWGDVKQLNIADKNGVGIHQAWVNLTLDPTFSIKLGRQEIVYDDSRIFGNVDWATQGRSHDIAVFKYKKNNFRTDVGFAFNQDGENLVNTTYTVPNNYKAMQYAWLHNDWNNLGASFLFLNNGLQYIDEQNSENNEVRYSQTVGTHLKYNKNKFSLLGNAYYQFGKDKMNNDLSAYLVGLETNYKWTQKVKTGLGVELQSGNDNGAPSNGENKAFTPFYGTNHKFNGLMDYFYVGNHANNVGLLDLYLKANFKLNTKSNLLIAFHNFSAAAELEGYDKKDLGNEIDLVYAYKFKKDVIFKAGYSQMFASEGMEVLKGNFDGNTNNWGWVMVVIKPTLFTSK
ncbi:alginate export family protein [Aureivirga marina]|uniref:alginate export family protein n=1 Tax=Aureivirga marina TaxID=1182451 RepID=UPI0018C8FF31|nr:alginate export family protein [Aureivirga marina]